MSRSRRTHDQRRPPEPDAHQGVSIALCRHLRWGRRNFVAIVALGFLVGVSPSATADDTPPPRRVLIVRSSDADAYRAAEEDSRAELSETRASVGSCTLETWNSWGGAEKPANHGTPALHETVAPISILNLSVLELLELDANPLFLERKDLERVGTEKRG